MYLAPLWTLLVLIFAPLFSEGVKDIWENVKCNEHFEPENCDLSKIPLITVDDFERCAPAKLPLFARNYYLGWAGRGITYRENRDAFERIFIKPKMLQDVSKSSLEVTTLGQTMSFPVGIAPTALHNLADPNGENATAAAAAAMGTVMILSSVSSTRLEDVAAKLKGSSAHLWMQLYVLNNRAHTLDIIRRCERSGVEAFVLTVDSNCEPPILCDSKTSPEISNMMLANAPVTFEGFEPALMTFEDIKWLKTITNIPIVAKGVMTGEDARSAINAGASAIIVSNHGGRQLDGLPASIEALSDVMKVLNNHYPKRDVYLDGGVRTGFDVYKALARGAKMVFVGRPVLWGLALEGERGVKRVLSILKSEFNSTMLLTGASNPNKVSSQGIIPSISKLQ